MALNALRLVWNKKKPRRRREPRKWFKWPAIPKPEMRDIFLFGGIIGAGYGVWLIYPPSAYVLVGGCFVALGLLLHMGGPEK